MIQGRPEEAVAAFQQVQGLTEPQARLLVQDMTQKSQQTNPEAGADEESIASKFNEIFGSPYNRQA